MTPCRWTLVWGLLAALASAQIDPHVWLPRAPSFAVPPAFEGLDVVDAAGNAVTSFTLPQVNLNGRIAVAKHPGGSVLVAQDDALKFFTPAGQGPVVAVPGIRGACVDPGGQIWTLEATFFGLDSLTRRDAAGAPLGTSTLPFAFSSEPIADPFGRVWVATGVIQPAAVIVDSTGAVFGPYPLTAPANQLLLHTVGGNGWLWYVDGATLRAIDPGGVARAAIPLPQTPSAIGVDLCLRPVLAFPDETIVAYDPVTQTAFPPVAAPATPGDYVGVAVAPDGRIWLVESAPGLSQVRVLERDGTPLAVVPSSGGMSFLALSIGDPLGTEQVAVVHRDGDPDGDGVSSGIEIGCGYDPVDPASTPPVPQIQGTVAQGSSFSVATTAPQNAGDLFVLAAALNTGGIVLDPADPCLQLPLAVDPMLAFWFSADNVLALPIISTLDMTGSTATSVFVPVAPFLSGVTIRFAGLALDPMDFSVSTITAPAAASIP